MLVPSSAALRRFFLTGEQLARRGAALIAGESARGR